MMWRNHIRRYFGVGVEIQDTRRLRGVCIGFSRETSDGGRRRLEATGSTNSPLMRGEDSPEIDTRERIGASQRSAETARLRLPLSVAAFGEYWSDIF